MLGQLLHQVVKSAQGDTSLVCFSCVWCTQAFEPRTVHACAALRCAVSLKASWFSELCSAPPFAPVADKRSSACSEQGHLLILLVSSAWSATAPSKPSCMMFLAFSPLKGCFVCAAAGTVCVESGPHFHNGIVGRCLGQLSFLGSCEVQQPLHTGL